jgi:hypothetical protein
MFIIHRNIPLFQIISNLPNSIQEDGKSPEKVSLPVQYACVCGTLILVEKTMTIREKGELHTKA